MLFKSIIAFVPLATAVLAAPAELETRSGGNNNNHHNKPSKHYCYKQHDARWGNKKWCCDQSNPREWDSSRRCCKKEQKCYKDRRDGWQCCEAEKWDWNRGCPKAYSKKFDDHKKGHW